MATYYEMLEVDASASVDEIKRAFRREIAKYHPDKVQHLGAEFQEIAATKAAELTQAYKTLSDAEARAEYDEILAEGGAPAVSTPRPSTPPRPSQAREPAERPDERQPEPEPQPADGGSRFSEDREGASALLRQATVMRFRTAVAGEFNGYEEQHLGGFELVCFPKPPFWSFKLPPRILGRFVERVDADAVIETWTMAARMKKDPQRDICVFLMGPEVATPGELASAIASQRRKPVPAGGRLVMVPVSTRTWVSHIPNDAPPVVKSLAQRLKAS